jgi:hypothetical protein
MPGNGDHQFCWQFEEEEKEEERKEKEMITEEEKKEPYEKNPKVDMELIKKMAADMVAAWKKSNDRI